MACVCMWCLGDGQDDSGGICLGCGGSGTWAVSTFAAWDGRPGDAALILRAERKQERREAKRNQRAEWALQLMAGTA